MLGLLLLSTLFAAGAFALAAYIARELDYLGGVFYEHAYREGFRDGHELGVMESNATGDETA